MTRWKVTTETGSVYIVINRGHAGWFVVAHNKAAKFSQALDPHIEWKIWEPEPWPPIFGSHLTMLSRWHGGPIDHPERMPGGGKATAPVKSVESLP